MKTLMRQTSLDAYDELKRSGLEPQEARVMQFFHAVGNEGRMFTRKEVSLKTGIPINAVCGRINRLVLKGFLFESLERRDGGYLLGLPAKQQELALA